MEISPTVSDFLTILAKVGSLAIPIVVGLMIMRKWRNLTTLIVSEPEASLPNEKAYKGLRSDIDALKTHFSKVDLSQAENPDIAALATRIDVAESNLRDLKTLLLDDPNVTLTIPLIKKDIDSLKENRRRMADEVGRLVGLFKWIIGIIFTLALGILATAASIAFR